MPTYEYECGACQHRFEKFQSITARPIRTCPQCGKRQVRRLIGAGAGVIFKGKGFYQTDYRSDSYNKAAEADKPKSDSSDSGKNSSSDGGSGAASSATAKTGAKPGGDKDG